jgi:hypothetical protein
MCDCIKNIDTDLAATGQCLDATMFGQRKATVMLIRKDKWVHENRRSKPTRMIANFCPFCGESYAKAAEALPGRRCDTNQVGLNGECVACEADNGEACKLPKSEAA